MSKELKLNFVTVSKVVKLTKAVYSVFLSIFLNISKISDKFA